MQPKYDFIVIGGGILGASTAMQLQERDPDCTVLVLEKEAGPAKHQTGHNSGVIHAGVYYKPGSLKAKFCKEGNQATRDFCDAESIPYDTCGKLLVATNALELERMQGLIDRCAQNALPIEVLDKQALNEREPNIEGEGAIFVPSTGIVSYTQITQRMLEKVEEAGGQVEFNKEVVKLEETGPSITVTTQEGSCFVADQLIACGGLMADRLVRMLCITPDFKVIPFRGEYFLLPPQHNTIVNHLIYPIPDPDLPFLGVHLTRMIDGTVTVGPNAVLAFKREGYKKSDISLSDTWEMLRYAGLRRVVRQHFKASLNEMKNSLYKPGYLSMVQKYCPSLTMADLTPYPAGIRAQAVSEDGRLMDDFHFIKTQRCLFVCNAPSPAATSAIPIGRHIIEQLTS